VSDPLIGREIKNFRIERLLGRGGMARVYYAWDLNLDRPAAIKFIDTQEQPDPNYVKRLLIEAKSIARWRHENIVQVYSADSQDGMYYFAMEFIDGVDLAGLLEEYAAEGKLISEEDILRIGWAVAHALDYAHQHGVIHRDVKPANVLIAKDGRIVLTDFGLALDVTQGTVGLVFGTPHYISPEQAVSSANVVPQSDLYSLGIILYEMLTGAVPFNDPSPISLAIQHINEAPPLPSDINPALGMGVEAVLLKALSKEPAERFQSGEELMAALEGALATPAPPEVEPTLPAGRFVSETSIAERVADQVGMAEPTQVHDAPDFDHYASPPQPPSTRRRGGGSAGLIAAIAGLFITALVVGGLALLLLLGNRGKADMNTDGFEPAVLTNIAITQAQSRTAVGGAMTQPATEAGLVLPATITPQPAQSTEPTGANEQPQTGYRVVLTYSDTGFYIWNPGNQVLKAASFTFEALKDKSGDATKYRFEGAKWSAYYPNILKGRCDAIELQDRAYTNRPSECLGYNATRLVAEKDDEAFWLSHKDVSTFRVLWDGDEVGRCEIAAGMCEVYLP